MVTFWFNEEFCLDLNKVETEKYILLLFIFLNFHLMKLRLATMSSLMLSLFLLSCLLISEGREILVGGKSNKWKIPESTEETLNNWSARTRFKIGDSLLWKYNAGNDSVLEVSEKDYERCDKSEPIRGFKDGNTKIELNSSGPFYFISGEEENCVKGEKLKVVVLSPNHRLPVDSVNDRNNAAAPNPVTAQFIGNGTGRLLNGVWGLILATVCLVLFLV